MTDKSKNTGNELDEILGGIFEAHLVKTDIQGRHFWEPRKEEVESAKNQIQELINQARIDELLWIQDRVVGEDSIEDIRESVEERLTNRKDK